MGKLRACFVIASLALIAACGSDSAKPDASIKIIDAPPDSPKVWEDAPPVTYDFSCLNGTAPTTGADPITIGGTTQTLSQNGTQAVPAVAVEVYKNGTASAVATVTSDTAGAFMTGNIATGGTPLNGYLRLAKATLRTTYLYPPTVVAASIGNIPGLMISNALFDQLNSFANGGAQDDATQGVLFFTVTDCSTTSLTPITGATAKIQQGGTDVAGANIFDLGAVASQAAGTYVVFNVPDGATEILVSYNGMNFQPRTVVAHKKPAGQNTEGTVTLTTVRPGP